MKITDKLIDDHKLFRQMIQELSVFAKQPFQQQDASDIIQRVEVFKQRLTQHAWIEDQFYCPVVRKDIHLAPTPLSVEYMDHLDSEHQTVDAYMNHLEKEVKAGVQTWPQTFALFSKGLISHMRREEDELFVASERWLGAARLEAISEEVERHYSEAPIIF